MNSVNLIGRLCKDPEIYQASNKEKTAIGKFTLAVDRIGSEEADFIRCTAFGKTAEFLEKYLAKGSRVGVSGRIQTGSYDTEDGETRYTTDVIVERLTFADGPRREDEDEKPAKKSYKKGGKK